MKVGYLDGVLSVEMIKELCEFVSHVGPKTVYLALDGGSIGLARTFISIINRTDELIVIGTNRLYSAGLLIFSLIDCPKTLTQGTRGMWHQGILEVEINTDGKPSYPSDRFNLSIHLENHSVVLDLAKKLSFTDREMRRLKKGKDVYLGYDRMNEIFPHD